MTSLTTLTLDMGSLAESNLNVLASLTCLVELEILLRTSWKLMRHPLTQLTSLTRLDYLNIVLGEHPRAGHTGAALIKFLTKREKPLSHLQIVHNTK